MRVMEKMMTDADYVRRIEPTERVAFETRIRELEEQLGEAMGQVTRS